MTALILIGGGVANIYVYIYIYIKGNVFDERVGMM
jgi:hypothetical protein